MRHFQKDLTKSSPPNVSGSIPGARLPELKESTSTHLFPVVSVLPHGPASLIETTSPSTFSSLWLPLSDRVKYLTQGVPSPLLLLSEVLISKVYNSQGLGLYSESALYY